MPLLAKPLEYLLDCMRHDDQLADVSHCAKLRQRCLDTRDAHGECSLLVMRVAQRQQNGQREWQHETRVTLRAPSVHKRLAHARPRFRLVVR